MNIFLTGGTGFLGKNFLKLALKKNHKVTALTRKLKKPFKHKNLKWLTGSIENNWTRELKKNDILVHFAAEGVTQSNPIDTYDVNIFQSEKLIKNAIKSHCKRWLIISSSSEYGNQRKRYKELSKNTNRLPNSDYALSKAIFSDIIVRLAKKYKCKARIMRVFYVFGVGEKRKRLIPGLINAISKNKNFVIKNPNEMRDFSDIKYVTNVLLDALSFNKNQFKYSQIWHVSEGKPKFIKDFANQLWKTKNAKGKLSFKKKFTKSFNHISDKNSLWKI